jgi:hypothetical protein
MYYYYYYCLSLVDAQKQHPQKYAIIWVQSSVNMHIYVLK